jgi:hypothetical protein
VTFSQDSSFQPVAFAKPNGSGVEGTGIESTKIMQGRFKYPATLQGDHFADIGHE